VFQRLRDGESECVETEGEFLVTNDKDRASGAVEDPKKWLREGKSGIILS
jgi:hypothetical protein